MTFRDRNIRTFVLGLDGVPFSFLKQQFNSGYMPNLASIAKDNDIKRINSVYPTVSSVAWTSYATGRNPAEHGIFGFIDRTPDPFTLKIPTAQDKKDKTIWKAFSEKKKNVIVINVPLTYPPETINGIWRISA